MAEQFDSLQIVSFSFPNKEPRKSLYNPSALQWRKYHYILNPDISNTMHKRKYKKPIVKGYAMNIYGTEFQIRLQCNPY